MMMMKVFDVRVVEVISGDCIFVVLMLGLDMFER